MKKLNFVSGLPRSGSSLLVNILNSNPNFHATTTSAVLDIISSLKASFSHNITWKTNSRLEIYDDFKAGTKGFLEGFYNHHEVIFDKCRVWPNKLDLIDHILDNEDSKVIWTYRNVADIVGSIEEHYRKTLLLENCDENSMKYKFATLDKRIGHYINEGGLVSYPMEMLKDAIEMGYGKRIMFVTYGDLSMNSQRTLDAIHDFLGEPKYNYDFDNIKQTVFENDAFHNYKFSHTIREGKIEFKESKNILPEKYINIINNRFEALRKMVITGDATDFLR